jgi:C4-type Zn-finger protein
MKCPRCLGSDTYVCKEGKEDGQLVWTMYYCNTCEFNWRDSEPAETIDPDLRPSAFQLDPTRLEDFEVVLPPRKRRP